MRRGVRASTLTATIAAIACAQALPSALAQSQGPTAAPAAAAAPSQGPPASMPALSGAAAPLDEPSSTEGQRMAALEALATEQGTHPLVALLSRAAPMPMRDLRLRHYVTLARALGERLTAPVDPDLASALLSSAANAQAPAAQIIAIRAIDAMPEQARPAGSGRFAVRRIAMATVPSRMVYDTKELTVAAGTPLCIALSNPDTLQHNLLIVTPGALSEIGIAGDKMGETAAGKACHFTPDSQKVLAVMGLVDPGSTGEVWFMAPAKPGTYPYVCTYPGHWRMMNGKMKVTAPPEPKGDSTR
jgi:azurin